MSDQDREERKREYNRLAQREFRKRRKEHLKNLEQLQKEQKSEQSDEIESLRTQNAQLRREVEALKSQIYGSYQLVSPTPVHPPLLSRSQSLGSVSEPMDSAQMIAPVISLAPSMSLPVVIPPGTLPSQPLRLSPQPESYQMSSHSSSRASPGLSALDHSMQSMNMSQSIGHQASLNMPHFEHQLVVVVPYDRTKFQTFLKDLFKPLLDPAVHSVPETHLAMLKTLDPILPRPLKPTKLQLETPHYYGIDILPSPTLRDRLIGLGMEVSRGFLQEIGCGLDPGGDLEDTNQVIIWGEDYLNEMSWEVSQGVLERWGWLLGPEFVQRANFWRRQRGAPLLPEW